VLQSNNANAQQQQNKFLSAKTQHANKRLRVDGALLNSLIDSTSDESTNER